MKRRIILFSALALLGLIFPLGGTTDSLSAEPGYLALGDPAYLAAPRNTTYATTISETWVTEPIDGVQIYTRILQPDPALYPDQQFPAVVLVPGGLGAGAPLVNAPVYQALAEQGFVVVGFNAPGRGTGQPGNLQSGGEEDCNGFAG